MAETATAQATDHLPFFIVGPGETDILFVGITIFLVIVVLIAGNLYFRLHAVPERMAHRAGSAQLQLVGVLALIALFTHNNLFWVLALLIAAFRIPDITTPLNAIATALEAGRGGTGTGTGRGPGEARAPSGSGAPATPGTPGTPVAREPATGPLPANNRLPAASGAPDA